MSKYTTELRFICENLAGLTDSVGADEVDDVISSARTHIFDFDYPIFDNAYKPTLEAKILDHYYTREIALETYGLWKQKLKAKMREIMPYYNKLYESELIEFNPLYDTDIRVDGNKISRGNTGGQDVTTGGGQDVTTAGGTDTRANADKNNTWDLYSDTPQGGINGIVGAEDDPSLGSNAFLSNARHIIGDTTGSTGSTTYGRTDTTNYGRTSTTDYGKTNTDASTYWETVAGYRGTNPSKSLMEFRKTFLNIDMQVIKELEDLFFQLW